MDGDHHVLEVVVAGCPRHILEADLELMTVCRDTGWSGMISGRLDHTRPTPEEHRAAMRLEGPATSRLFPLLELVRWLRDFSSWRWLRDQRGKFRGQIQHCHRVRRGRAEARNAAAEQASERGVAAKKQVFARALKRVNGRLDSVLASKSGRRCVPACMPRSNASAARRCTIPRAAVVRVSALRRSRTPRVPTLYSRRRSAASRRPAGSSRRAATRGSSARSGA